MPSYGPWTQDADYVRDWRINTNDPDDYVQTIVDADQETPYQDPVYPITPDDLTQMFEAIQVSMDHIGGWVEYLNSGYNLSFPNWKSGWACKIWSRTFPFTNRQHQYNPPNFGSSAPEGAIGIDYVNRPYDPEDPWGWADAENLALRLRAITEFEGQFEDGRVLGGQPLPWASPSMSKFMLHVDGNEFDDEIALLAGPSFSTSPNWYERTLDEAIDLTPYGALEPGWQASVWTNTPVAQVGGDPGPYADTQTSFGWLVNDLRFEADVRPPLYRWVYEDVSVPYRRTFPRDDGLAGGARRTYPPSRATQSSNRTSGYL